MKLQVLKKSSKRPLRGDIFRLQHEDGRIFYGKVLADNVDPTFMRIPCSEGERAKLWAIAIYSPSESCEKRFAEFLCEPQIVNRQGWLRGYFETIGKIEPSPYDIENSRYWVDFSGSFYEIDWKTLTGKMVSKPNARWIGDLGVGNHLTTADWISSALGEDIE